MFAKIFVAALATLLCTAIPAHADSVQLLPGGAAFSDPATGDSMSPYTAIVNGQTIAVFCIDFSTAVPNNASWTAGVTLLANTSSYANTLQFQMTHSNSASQTNYLEMAWLVLQLQSALAANDVNLAAQDQWAIWSFSGGLDPYGTDATLLAEAQAAVSSNFTVTNWEILTPVAGQRGQEFLALPVPEPGTIHLLLAGFALVAASGVLRKLHAF